MKLGELINAVESLNVLGTTKLPAAASFKVASFLKIVADDVQNYQDIRNEKLKAYGEEKLDEEGKPTGQFNLVEDNLKKFAEEMTDLNNTDVNKPIPVLSLTDLGDVVIEPKHLLALSWLIKE